MTRFPLRVHTVAGSLSYVQGANSRWPAHVGSPVRLTRRLLPRPTAVAGTRGHYGVCTEYEIPDLSARALPVVVGDCVAEQGSAMTFGNSPYHPVPWAGDLASSSFEATIPLCNT